MTVLPDIARGAVLGLSAAATPGPLQALVVARSVRVGPRRALPLALVPASSDPVAITTALLVLSQVPPAFLRSITAVGAAVVLWMAVATVRSALRGDDPGAGHAPPSRGFLAVAAVNVTNPGAWIFWSAVGAPLIASAWRQEPLRAVAFVASFFTCITAGNAAVVLLAAGMASAGPRAARGLGLASGAALLGFGSWLVVRLLHP